MDTAILINTGDNLTQLGAIATSFDNFSPHHNIGTLWNLFIQIFTSFLEKNPNIFFSLNIVV